MTTPAHPLEALMAKWRTNGLMHYAECANELCPVAAALAEARQAVENDANARCDQYLALLRESQEARQAMEAELASLRTDYDAAQLKLVSIHEREALLNRKALMVGERDALRERAETVEAALREAGAAQARLQEMREALYGIQAECAHLGPTMQPIMLALVDAALASSTDERTTSTDTKV